MKYNHLTKWDTLIALALLVIALIWGLGILDKGHVWGDDFAGYMLHAQTLVEGDFEQMQLRNAILHPSPRSFEEGVINDSPLAYVWGLPMVLSFVYRLVGYDAPMGETIIYYKIPGAVFFALFAGMLYLFYRRRFSAGVSLFLTFMLCGHRRVFGDVNNVMTDIPCLAASMASLLGMEIFVGETRAGRKALYGVLLGVALWYTAVVRLNGISVVLCVLLGQTLYFARIWKTEHRRLLHLLPWALFGLLYLLVRLYLPEVDSNASDVASVTLGRIKGNILYYYGLMQGFFAQMLPAWMPGRNFLHLAMYVLIIVGLVARGWRREEIHLSILLCGTGAVLLMLPYEQDVRYLFGILPLMLLFAGYGAAAVACWVGHRVRSACARRAVVCTGAVVMLAASLLRAGELAAWKWNWQQGGGRESLYEAYHPVSRDIYAYISEHVEEDAVIAYIKPRVLYLNTGRMGFVTGVNGHHFYDADYILTFQGREDEVGAIIWPELDAELTLVYENPGYELYRISDTYKALRYENE